MVLQEQLAETQSQQDITAILSQCLLRSVSLYLNIIILVSPIFPDSYYEEPASNSLYTLKLNGYPHVFVLDKDSNQCCYFLSNSGKDLDKNYVDNILQQIKLSDFIKMLG